MPPRDRRRRILAVALAAALLALGANGCDSRLDPPLAVQSLSGEPSTTGGLSVAPASVELRVGGATQLTVTGPSALLPAVFTTDNASVATVSSSGLVTAVGTGTAVITASSSTDPTRRAAAVVRVLTP